MSAKINVSLVQFNPASLQAAENGLRMCEFAQAEAKQGANLIVFPELSNTGYVEPLVAGQPISDGVGGTLHPGEFAQRLQAAAATVDGPLIEQLRGIAERYKTHIVAGLALRDATQRGVLYNSSALIGPDGLFSVYHKIHLWHCEKLYFTPGRRIDVFDTALGKLGMQVCYDIRFPEITRIMSLKGATIVTSVWAAPFPVGKALADGDIFRHRAYTRATENGIFFLSCNRVGVQAGHEFLGRSLVAAPNGDILAAADNTEETVVRAQLDPALVDEYRCIAPVWLDRRPDVYEEAMADL
ncbi:(R)-stereoselective amidase [Paraburkholderia caffeinitolerans]|uniref:(R)-stereoselective amidase n=1 Tax=Paraburkholderia caffeinitolerans TaxID=1723730 RepID=A0A6J5GLI8_9BURK|nr:carbon-nitrogen hydrolase family protein [Paraburkholderia caffeinitolerans]CAB3801569.1 (R)-stereoselective amidase [Paraburkholderia caffeinitolerans]